MMNKHFCLLPLTILFLGKTHHLSIGKHDFANLLASKLKSFLQKFSFNSSDNDKWIEIMDVKEVLSILYSKLLYKNGQDL